VAKALERGRLEAERNGHAARAHRALEAELADYAPSIASSPALRTHAFPPRPTEVAYQLASYQGGNADLSAVLVARRN